MNEPSENYFSGLKIWLAIEELFINKWLRFQERVWPPTKVTSFPLSMIKFSDSILQMAARLPAD